MYFLFMFHIFLGDCYHWHETPVHLFPYSTKKKSFLHNFQLALVESVDFDTQEDNLASVNQALAKKVFFYFRYYSY